jgi:hypothetical protein
MASAAGLDYSDLLDLLVTTAVASQRGRVAVVAAQC